MNSPLTGIHHVTAIASDPQKNLGFYNGVLGLRLVKKTVNFDDPSAYHLYYGDEAGRPGSIVTFFYWPGGAGRGRVGTGQMTRLSFSVGPTALDFWRDRLQQSGTKVEALNRFGEETLTFSDPDGIPVEIVGVTNDVRLGWTGTGIKAEHALHGLHATELTLRDAQLTEKLVSDVMGYRLVKRDGNRARFEIGSGGPGTYIDLINEPNVLAGLGGVGTIHHVAWRVPDDAGQLLMQDRLGEAGFGVSTVRDRTYFRSIYYREHGGILFEIATEIPGFAVDEPNISLGTALKLPSQFERARKEIEAILPPIRQGEGSA